MLSGGQPPLTLVPETAAEKLVPRGGISGDATLHNLQTHCLVPLINIGNFYP